MHFNVSPISNTVYYFSKEKILVKFKAAIGIIKDMGGVYQLLGGLFSFFPTGIADKIYDIVAKNRYRLFGRKLHCDISGEYEMHIKKDCHEINPY